MSTATKCVIQNLLALNPGRRATSEVMLTFLQTILDGRYFQYCWRQRFVEPTKQHTPTAMTLKSFI